MTDYKKLREIQRVIKLTKALKEYKKILLIVDARRKEHDLKKWYDNHRELIDSLSDTELTACSEAESYDKEEWLKIVAQLKKDFK